MTASRLATLAALISENSDKVEAYIAQKGFSPVSFDADTPSPWIHDSEISQARQILLDSADEMHALMLGPIGVLTNPSVGPSKPA